MVSTDGPFFCDFIAKNKNVRSEQNSKQLFLMLIQCTSLNYKNHLLVLFSKSYLTSGLDKGFGIENVLKTNLRTIQ